MNNIAAHLPLMARTRPDALAIACPAAGGSTSPSSYTRLSFRELDQLTDELARGLESFGIGRGTRTTLMVKPGIEFFGLTFALWKVGAVLVLVDPGIGRQNLRTCLAEAEPEAFIGGPLAHLARIALGWGRPTVKHLVTVGDRWLWGGTTYADLRERGRADAPYTIAPTADDDVAAVLFTSGSTGVPKGAVYTHGNFAAQVESLRATYGIEPGEIDLPTFPLFALFDPALGSTAIIPAMNFKHPGAVDPRSIIEPIREFGVTSMFGSPALVDRVGRHGAANGIKLPSLRRVISAGAPVQPAVLERFSTMLSRECEIHTPYGATEALPVCTIGSRAILEETRQKTETGAGICVGHPVGGLDVRVIHITDEPIATWSDDLGLPDWEVGEIAVRGPVVTRSYHNLPQATVLAKIPVGRGGDVFHRMGDLGYRDSKGRIWFCGRKTQRVLTEAGPLYTIPCESIFNTHPSVHRSALVGVAHGEYATPVIIVELEAEARKADRATLVRELLALGAKFPHTEGIATVLFHGPFPVDIRHNAKIFREKLAIWAAGQLAR